MNERPLLADDCKTEHVRETIAQFHPEVVSEVRRAVDKDDIVVVGMAQNPFVKRARAALDEAGFAHTYLEYGSYLSQWRKRLAIKLWSGWPLFPQVFVKGTLIGGNSETRKAIADGTLKQRLDGDRAA